MICYTHISLPQSLCSRRAIERDKQKVVPLVLWKGHTGLRAWADSTPWHACRMLGQPARCMLALQRKRDLALSDSTVGHSPYNTPSTT